MVRVATLVLAGAIALGACGEPQVVPLNADGDPDVELELGRDRFAQRCAVCHGAAAGGGTGPKLKDGEAEKLYPDVEDMLAVIAEGKDSGMPSFGKILTADERRAVARYIREVLG